jgi:hypothetical protein
MRAHYYCKARLCRRLLGWYQNLILIHVAYGDLMHFLFVLLHQVHHWQIVFFQMHVPFRKVVLLSLLNCLTCVTNSFHMREGVAAGYGP